MALGFTAALQAARLDEITTAIDAGSGAGKVRIYDGTRPANTDTAVPSGSTLLAELVMNDPSFPAASGTPASMTANAITDDTSADATGTATWFRIVDSDNNARVDGDVATAASDLNLNSVSINSGVNVAISSLVLTSGNQ